MKTIRRRYLVDQKRYFENLYEEHGEIPSNHYAAIRLRMDYFQKEILDRVSKYVYKGRYEL